jgi:glutaredoxin
MIYFYYIEKFWCPYCHFTHTFSTKISIKMATKSFQTLKPVYSRNTRSKVPQVVAQSLVDSNSWWNDKIFMGSDLPIGMVRKGQSLNFPRMQSYGTMTPHETPLGIMTFSQLCWGPQSVKVYGFGSAERLSENYFLCHSSQHNNTWHNNI